MKKWMVLGFALLAAAGFVLTQYMIYYMAPVDKTLFFNQKIFYYHVPNAFMLFLSVFVCGFYSLLFLKKGEGRFDDAAQSAGMCSVLFGAIVLVTGSIWGKAAWGVWWDWDPRMSTSLLLWVSMLSYVLVRRFGGTGSERLGAGLAVFAAVNIPLVYFSVRWASRSLHPQTTVVPQLTGEMRATLWTGVLVFLFFYLVLQMVGTSILAGHRRLHELREQALDAGLL